MSNFTGVTFAKQKVLPSDDAIIRRAILSDGILYGCELSYSGSTLTMGAGHLLICGRQARHPSVQNWAVVGATSGYARLVLTVDLSRTASKDYFDQIKDSVEYASAVDGFPELEQADVNVSGTRYQVVACVVSLGAGGITGFVSQLGPCEVAGGGGLNFKLVGGLTQPADPAENKIWVETDTAITFYDFSATEPAEPVENMVWISLGTSSPAAFNALKKNSVMVYPISAKQYVSGAWVDKTAKSYQGGKWVDWVIYLINGSELNTEYAGTWNQTTGGQGVGGSAEMTSEGLLIKANTATQYSGSVFRYGPDEKINFSGVNSIEFVVSIKSGSGKLSAVVTDEFATGYDSASVASVDQTVTGTDQIVVMDVSGVSGNHYLRVGTKSTASAAAYSYVIKSLRLV